MKKKIGDILFCLVFLSMILIPFLKLDTTETIDSALENRTLTKWPGLHFTKEYNEWYGHYVEDRVAFREEAIRFYINATYGLFHEFSEDLHAYGQDGHIFPANTAYVQAYQHLNTDEALIDNLVTYLDRTSQYASSKGATFVFMAGLDKKSVYEDYFPETIHVKEDEPSIMGLLKEKLEEADVSYVIPVDEFKAVAEDELIYNKKYDCAHWNEKGALFGIQLVDEIVRKEHPELPALSAKDFNLKYEKKQIEFISLPIEEEVPVYQLKKKRKIKDNPKAVEGLSVIPGTNFQSYYNRKAKCDTTILIMHDSFLEDKAKFFTYRYKEVYMVPRQNYTNMQEYIDKLNPDVVLFENAERAFVDDLYAYTELANIVYETGEE